MSGRDTASAMPRLTQAALLPPDVVRPTYDRAALRPGIVHIGLGAFHRAHQAVYTDAALAAHFGPWGIIGVNLRSVEGTRALSEQDGLYSVVTRSADGDRVQVVGALVEVLAAANQRAEVLDRLADAATRIVTLTVTEKAYGIDPKTGGLDLDHPAIAADLAAPTEPVGVIGLLVEGLARRYAAGIPPFTVLCCDNLPENGHIVRRLVLAMAERRDPAIAGWIAALGAFPSSMVDRIVPAATDETRRRAAELLGHDDQMALETERFIQWVVEDRFVDGRPAWEAGGALFVADVVPYEQMKLRMLNGAHSLIAYLGQLRGLPYVKDVMAVPAYAAIVRRHMRSAARTLGPVPGIDLDTYAEQLIERFANPTILHRTEQIAMDGSQKLPQRILSPAVDARRAGRSAASFAYVVALWIAFLRQSTSLNDPRQDELLAAAAQVDTADASASFFRIPGLFPAALIADRPWRDTVNRHLAELASEH